MSTPHIQAELNEMAKTVLMPGDPLRAKYIAETYLEDVRCINSIRNMLGFTGTYHGRKVSVMGSGMGMPSIGIYSYELFSQYNVEEIIRIGTAGSYREDCRLFDVVLASESYSESSFAKVAYGYRESCMQADGELNEKIVRTASELNMKIHPGVIHSSDCFYHGVNDFQKMVEEKGCLCVEMESFALFANARYLKKKASCLLTISDSLVTHEVTTAKERETAFTRMMEIALGTLER